MSASRFPLPRETSPGRLWASGYEANDGNPVYFRPARGWDEFITAFEADQDAFFLTFEIQLVDDCELEVLGVSVGQIGKDRKVMPVKVAPGLQEVALQFLRDNPHRLAAAKAWLLVHGEREDWRRAA